MSYITLGAASELQIKVPSNGFTGWGDVMRTDTFLKIATHLHTGAGDGSILGTSSLLADAVTGAKILLSNNEYLRGRNAGDSADIDIVKIDTADNVVVNVDRIASRSTASLADNTAVAATTGIITLSSNESVYISYKIIRGTDVQSGTLEIEQSNATVVDSYSGDDTGVTFSLDTDVLFFSSTSTGNAATISYIITEL